MNYKDFELNVNQIKILKTLIESPYDNLESFNKEDINFLLNNKFIKENTIEPFFENPTNYPYYFLENNGMMYLLHRKRTSKEMWLPIIVSFLTSLATTLITIHLSK